MLRNRWLSGVPVMLRNGWPYGVPVVVYVLHAMLYRKWLVDDALISMAYARTLTLGGGMAQTPGSPQVEGISDPLWTLILAGLRWVGLSDRGHVIAGVSDYVWTVKLLGVALFVVTLALIAIIVRETVPPSRRPWPAVVIGVLVATNPAYVIWSVSGLENGLYAAIVTGLVALLTASVARGSWLRWAAAVGSGLLVFAAAVTRPDGVIFVAVYPLVALGLAGRGTLLRTIGRIGASVLAFGVPFGALLLWRWSTFGLLVPNTAVAKAQGIPTAADAAAGAWGLVLVTGGGVTFVVLGTVIVFLAYGLRRTLHGPRRRADHTARPALPAWGPLVTALLLAAAIYVILAPDWMGEYRFATPFVVLSATMVVLAIDRCLGSPVRRGRLLRAGRVIVVLVGIGSLVSWVWTAVPRATAFAAQPTVPGCQVADRYGRTFNWYARELHIDATKSTLLAPDLGGTLLTSQMTVVDLAGLTDPEIARIRATGTDAQLTDEIFAVRRPTFIHMHSYWMHAIFDDPRLERDYVVLFQDGFSSLDYVRRDAIPPGVDLDTVRAGAANRIELLSAMYSAWPGRDCGPLVPGQISAKGN
ncbi:hypothetical protein [Raineyella sp. W15-4]|uniref:hypothetical protein n=1 Tax=Raineyella sp. W15-4 TaxID=3081651 RepID=UPI002954E24C|nr:hypothetical protein [Raineyella sp. W15-4]WOQ16444.1 hypothetical protein R0145_14750 [Raineyella sp. W15-4]